jgi:hypothetical protein
MGFFSRGFDSHVPDRYRERSAAESRDFGTILAVPLGHWQSFVVAITGISVQAEQQDVAGNDGESDL